MTSISKVIPFGNDDLKVEEIKQVNNDSDEFIRRAHSGNPGKVNYGNFVKKQQENKTQNSMKKNTMKTEQIKMGGRFSDALFLVLLTKSLNFKYRDHR